MYKLPIIIDKLLLTVPPCYYMRVLLECSTLNVKGLSFHFATIPILHIFSNQTIDSRIS